MSETGSFDTFLHALDQIEGQQFTTTHCECQPESFSKTPTTKLLHCKCRSADSSVEWVSETSKNKSKARPKRYSLQRPGFIYRKKDLSRSSYLDNNLWEYTRGRRVLKSPSFRYRTKLKPATTHSATILEDMCNLRLHSDPQSDVRTGYKETTNACEASDNSNSGLTFLPLRSNLAIHAHASVKPWSKRKSLIKPSRFGRKTLKERSTATGIYSCKQAMPFSWSSQQVETFQQLSSNTEKFDAISSLRSAGQYRDSVNSSCNQKSTLPPRQDSQRELKEARTLPDMDRSCSLQARIYEHDPTTDELSLYVEDMLFLPQKMSSMAETMYT